MKTMTFKIDEKMSHEIEVLQYESESKKDILAYMIYNDYPINDAFKKYQEDYMTCFTKYNMAKDHLQKAIIEPKVKGKLNQWTLDFESCEVTVEYAEN